MRQGRLLSIVFALLLWGTLLVQPGRAADDAQFFWQDVPTVLTPGQSYLIRIQMTNTGTTPWTVPQYKLGSQNLPDNLTWGVNRVDLSDPCTTYVPPGYLGCFYFTVTAPTTPGAYNFQWRMIHEGVGWFGEFTPNIPIVVTPGGTGACDEEGCRNSTTFNPVGPATGSYWVATTDQRLNLLVFVNGSTANLPQQPGGISIGVPTIEAFGPKVFLAVRGAYSWLYINSWNGISWSGWTGLQGGATLNSPDMVVFHNTLFLSLVGLDHAMWVNRYTTTWLGWQNVGGYVNDTQICADNSYVVVGGTGGDGLCWRTPSADGVVWLGWLPAPACPF